MRMANLILMIAAAAFCAAPVFSQSVYIWDKDHDNLFPDPEGGGSVDSTYGIMKALTTNGVQFSDGKDLPPDLGPYDILFVIMGGYC